MKQCLEMVTANLKNLSQALTIKYKGVAETNISAAASYLAKLTATYRPMHKEIYEKSPLVRHQVPIYVKFGIGGLAGVTGQALTHPMDVLKVRMQVYKSDLLTTMKQTTRAQGVLGLYTGLSASLLRQITYTTTRLGIFNTMSEICEKHFGRLNYPTLISVGMLAGMIAALVGTPTDVVMVRMIADVGVPLGCYDIEFHLARYRDDIRICPEKRRSYKHAIDGLFRIVKEEGIHTLWTGAMATVCRAAIANGAQLGTYSRSKTMLKDTGHFEDGLPMQFVAGLISGLVAGTASLPMDIAKTRIQNWKESDKPPGTGKMLLTIYRSEGLLSLWRGFLPYYARLAPNTVITMVTMDQLTRFYLMYFQS
ncbi:mitochondrial 2-oxoglutarate/malate carrier protein-like [Diprion similis]|uniref:mitochondrial 2-oxoglutarate/malate carrier protein-like n=1 Tax=Diprion similis TaxID=362088 RepID=UPI001EF8F237|nr:mitochondrial 2-oxoglutarate/malate carrier protein-like [Diprion similis]